MLADVRRAIEGWRVGTVVVRVRYSRGADFSGTCFYKDRRIFINIGRHVKFPYPMRTNLARAVTKGRVWIRPVYVLDLRDAHQMIHFIFLHELFHLLVKIAKRNTRQKESMCDRFAARALVDRFGLAVRTDQGKAVPREEWDFQNLEGFVAAARSQKPGRVILTRSLPRTGKSLDHPSPFRGDGKVKAATASAVRQLVLFPM